ncbi:MurR/RpiR family transcriptional regulator [Lentilitoribacter sp. Alg239-R112]|uniref:MurR/RpiR family transcriptional regulator n=1 Tax=Lentilitoribacter sp. Alg239-R112 TaxID=2305987 RepID=UPI0013A6B157|nr:MurR/RpiR family transcriptional regulator [Lentilitoribacter sp. Alg239-R112]
MSVDYTFDLMKRLATLSLTGRGALCILAEFCINNRDVAADMPLKEIATATGVSETSVFRFAQQLGFTGYRDLRLALAELRGLSVSQSDAFGDKQAKHSEPYSLLVQNTVHVHSSILKSTAELLDSISLRKTIAAIQDALVIQVLGFGSSVSPVIDFYQRLIRFGYVTNNYSDPHVLTAVTSNPPPGSLFFAISFSGESKDVVDALKAASAQSMNCILITSNPEASACKYADIILYSAPAGAITGSETVATRVSQLAIIDMICTGLALEHPRKNEFLRNAAVLEREIERNRVHPIDPTYISIQHNR